MPLQVMKSGSDVYKVQYTLQRLCGITHIYFIHRSGFVFCITQVGKVSSNTGKAQFEGLVHFLRYNIYSKNLGLRYYVRIEDAPLSDLLRKASINCENQLMAFSDSGCQDCQYTGRSTSSYIVFYKGGSIDHFTYVPGPFYQSSVESYYNSSWTAGRDIAYFRTQNNNLINKDPYAVP